MQEIKLPRAWTQVPGYGTRTELFAQRKKDAVPHQSFDLDGDGVVGSQDLVVSKLFDHDHDGILDAKERSQAIQAIKGVSFTQGILEKYLWGVEESGATRGGRLMMKRGVIVDQEDFSDVQYTYPKPPHPTLPHCKTLSELKALRAQAPASTFKHPPRYIQLEPYHPAKTALAYTSMSEKRRIEQRQARLSVGLSEETTLINPPSDPSLSYIPQPKYRSRSQMNLSKRESQLSSLSQTANFSHKTADQRLEAREVHTFAPLQDSRTLSNLKSVQRKEINEYNMKTFSNVVVGIHGQELPKFKDVEYWKMRPDYVEAPGAASRTELVRRQRFWQREGGREENRSFVLEKKTAAFPEKPNRCVPGPIDRSTLENLKKWHKNRWTSLIYQCKTSLISPEIPKPKESVPVSLNETSEMESAVILSPKSRVSNRPKRPAKPKKQVQIRSSGFPVT